MGFLTRYINNLLLSLCGFTMLSVASACSDADVPDPGQTVGEGPIVTLRLAVGINSPQQMLDSRAAGEYPAGFPYDFEAAATVWEGINTLRVVIVRPDNSIEGNNVFTFSDYVPKEGILYGPMEFPVKSNETKRIYLVANEASITPSVDWTQYVPGATLTSLQAEKMMQYRAWPVAVSDTLAVPYIDNTGAQATKKYVPMTEFFDTFIKAPADNSVKTSQSATYFITRNVVKFGFTVSSQTKDGSVAAPVNSFRVKSLTFRNVMQKSYLFPYETVYIPGKDENTTDFRRIISHFTTPGLADNLVRPYRFPVADKKLGVNSAGSSFASTQVYMPELYFNETSNNTEDNRFDIDVEVEFEGADESVKYYRVQLPNLPEFPRNTFVKVNLIMRERDLTAVVDVVPYISVTLNPIFGFEQINPGS